MLDVRITGYVVPVAEQPQASLTPVISVENVADEDAVITGLIRIYRESTGLLIYDSKLAVTQLEHMTATNIAALTPFDPPAPADDDYFIKADLVATSYLPGPPLPVTLGAWHFDIKTPPMGQAPAGHHGTHELGGSDVVPHSALAGLAGDDHPQYQEEDEKGIAGGYCGLPNPLDTTLPLRADGTPAWPTGLRVVTDFFDHSSGSLPAYPWTLVALSAGSAGPIPGTPNHPGIHRISSSVNANSGARCTFFSAIPLLTAGSETTDLILRPQSLPLTTLRFGFLDTGSSGDATDGCYLESVAGTIYGKTASNSVRSTTGTNYLTVTNTWYRLRATLNAAATRVDFYLFAENGTQLWTDFLTTNIPTAAGRETGHGIVATNSGTTALALVDLDYMNLWIARALVR